MALRPSPPSTEVLCLPGQLVRPWLGGVNRHPRRGGETHESQGRMERPMNPKEGWRDPSIPRKELNSPAVLGLACGVGETQQELFRCARGYLLCAQPFCLPCCCLEVRFWGSGGAAAFPWLTGATPLPNARVKPGACCRPACEGHALLGKQRRGDFLPVRGKRIPPSPLCLSAVGQTEIQVGHDL